MQFRFTKLKKIYFIFTGIVVLICLGSLAIYKINPGPDFTGGSILEVNYINSRPSNPQISQALSGISLGQISIQPTGSKGVIIRMESIDESTHQAVLKALGNVQEVDFESIGPTVGAQLKNETLTIIILSLAAMFLYIIFSFRKVSFPVPSWKYGAGTILILIHDTLIPLGVFSLLGKFYGVQITIPVVVAILTVVGYAINNVVVVFDRIRENLTRRTGVSFSETVDGAINQTLTRQVNTSLTTLFPLIFIYFLGGETLRYFALALIVGIIAGLYSSIFLAGPILASWVKKGVDKRF